MPGIPIPRELLDLLGIDNAEVMVVEESHQDSLEKVLMAIVALNGNELVLPRSILDELHSDDLLEAKTDDNGDLRIRRTPAVEALGKKSPKFAHYNSRGKEPYIGKQIPVKLPRRFEF
jgi:hypothetical protein